tara:strand:- start:3496 stop:4614 length:1119 start_codon:yes stop_codon:yes gene_type:complete
MGFSCAFSAQAMDLRRACDPAEDTLTIGGVGDLLIHKYIQNAAQKKKGHYSYLWKNVKSHIQGVDIMYANLETPLAAGVARDGTLHPDPGVFWDEREYIYSGYPAFNTPPELAKNLKAGGFDIVSTANNHAADRGLIGIDKTIDSLESAGLQFTGSRRKGDRNSFATIVNKKGWKVAFIACTYGVNGKSGTAIRGQILQCYSQKSLLLSEIRNARKVADVVVVTPHWGTENVHRPQSSQVSLAQEIVDAGADLVIGTHAHVVQPIQKFKSSDGREVPVVFGTGNFVSSQPGINKLGLMVIAGFSRRGNQVWANGLRHLPLYMTRSYLSVDFLDQVKPENQRKLWSVVSNVVGNDFGLMNSREPIKTNPLCGN